VMVRYAEMRASERSSRKRSNVALQLTAALRIAPAVRALLLDASAAELMR